MRSRFLQAESQPGARFPKQISQNPVWSAALLILHSFSCHIHSAATQIFPFSPRSEGLWEPHLPTSSLGRLSLSFLSLSLSPFRLSWEQHTFRVYSLSVSALYCTDCSYTSASSLSLTGTETLTSCPKRKHALRWVRFTASVCLHASFLVHHSGKHLKDCIRMGKRFVISSVSLCCLELSFEILLRSGFM